MQPYDLIVIGSGPGGQRAAIHVGRGAQDYLLPDHLDSYSLTRALRNAIERKAVEDALYLEKERPVVTLHSIGDAVLCTDISGRITYLNLVAPEDRREHSKIRDRASAYPPRWSSC